MTAGRVRRIMVYVPHLRIGGGEISMLRLAGGLAAAGQEVDLVVHSASDAEQLIPAGVVLRSLHCASTAAALWRLARLLRERQPAYLLSAFPHTNIAALAAVRLSGQATRCVMSEHAPLSLQIRQQIRQQNNWRYRVLPPLVRWAYRRAAAVVAVSQGVRDDLHNLLGSDAGLQLIHNPVLAEDFAAEMALPVAEPWLADPSLQVVLSVSRLSVEKDLRTLLRAFAEVHRSQPQTRLIMAGEGPDRASLAALIVDQGLDDVVRLPGRTTQPLAWMRQAAVFVLASQYEGFGNVLVEAMACGTPVVSTDCPVGPREILEDGRLGALVPVGDVAAMATAIRQALVGGRALQAAQESARRYTQANSCAAYLRLFENLERGALHAD